MEEIIKEEVIIYNEIVKKLYDMGIIWKNTFNTDFEIELFISKFDLMLQSSLISIALLDGKCSREEIYFIKNVAKHGNILDIINKKFDSNIDWDDLSNCLKEKTLKDFEVLVDNELDDVFIEYSSYFSAIDYNSSENYVDFFIKKYSKLLYLLLSIGEQDNLKKDDKKVKKIINKFMDKYNFCIKKLENGEI